MPRRIYSWMLKKRGTIQRATYANDASGGPVPTWAALSADATNVRCVFWQKKRNEKSSDFEGESGVSEFEFAFEDDYGARQGDRIVVDGVYYELQGVPMDWTNGGIGNGPYTVKTVRRDP